MRFALANPRRFQMMFAMGRGRAMYERFVQAFAGLGADARVAAAAAWSLVHGLAQLCIAGHLDASEDFVRKVLGASVANIAGLLSKDFVKLVLAANLVAWPIAYFAMNRWLQDFAYRVNIGWWVFALAGGIAVLIALLTVSLQAIRAALANPVEALRYE